MLGRHLHDQAPNLREHAGPSRLAPRVHPLLGDQLPMPAQNRVGRDNGCHLRQKAATETRAEGSQAPSVVVC
jgi:hypothetical protein